MIPTKKNLAFRRKNKIYIYRPDGFNEYDLDNCTHTVLEDVNDDDFDVNFVPIFCDTCYGNIKEDYTEAIKQLSPTDRFFIGTAGIFDANPHSYEETNYPTPVEAGDLATKALSKYYLNLSDVKYIVHPSPGVLLWQHHGNPIGEVLFYWHVHRNDKCGVNALAKLCTDSRSIAFWDLAKSHNSGFSWTTVNFGHGDIIIELSTVFVPARPGCFATYVTGDKISDYLSLLQFSPQNQQNNDIMTELLIASVPQTANINPLLRQIIETQKNSPPISEPLFKTTQDYQLFIRELMDNINNHIEINKLLYKHKGKTAIEEHIRHGKDKFKSINGDEASRYIFENMISANASQASTQPINQPPVVQYVSTPHPIPPHTIDELKNQLGPIVIACMESYKKEERKRKAETDLLDSIDNIKLKLQKFDDLETKVDKLLSASTTSMEPLKNIASTKITNHEPVTGPPQIEAIVKTILDSLQQSISSIGLRQDSKSTAIPMPHIQALIKTNIEELMEKYIKQQLLTAEAPTTDKNQIDVPMSTNTMNIIDTLQNK